MEEGSTSMDLGVCGQGGASEMSIPGSPLDVGNFFSDLMHTPRSSREMTPGTMFETDGSGVAAGSAAGGMGAAAGRKMVLPSDIKIECSFESARDCQQRLPQLKEEAEGVNLWSADRRTLSTDSADAGSHLDSSAPAGGVVHVPDIQEDSELRSVCATCWLRPSSSPY